MVESEKEILKKHVDVFDVTNSYSKVLSRFVDSKEVYPVTKLNVEYVRKLNDLLVEYTKLGRVCVLLRYLIQSDDTLTTIVKSRCNYNILELKKSLSPQVKIMIKLKSKLKACGVGNKNNMFAINHNIKIFEERKDRISNSIITSYLELSRWSSFLNYLNTNNIRLVDFLYTYAYKMEEIDKSMNDMERVKKIDKEYIKLAVECANEMDSKINKEDYDPNNNEYLRTFIIQLEKDRNVLEKQREEQRKKELLDKQYKLEGYANRLMSIINSHNSAKRVNVNTFRVFENRLRKVNGASMSTNYALLACMKMNKSDNGIHLKLKSEKGYTQDLSKAKIYTSMRELEENIKDIRLDETMLCLPMYLEHERYV